ncbi:MAG: thioredoxin family protein [Saprospiraceae bacterium]|nr:thioredoxin family protein [Saprospiraceae bacterium]
MSFVHMSCSQSNTGKSKSSTAGYQSENEGWLVDVDEAYALSKKTNKPILANFTGSDWCIWCKRLTAAVFVHDEFKNWAKKNVILLELDFPRGKSIPAKNQQQNQSMQQALQVQGFPTIWLFDLNKKNSNSQYSIDALGSTGYTTTPKEFISKIESFIAQRKK